MSVNFYGPVNDEAIEKLRKVFGQEVAGDRKTFLYDKLDEIEQSKMKEVVKAAGQSATVELNSIGTIKTMSDGTRYKATPTGWKRLPPEEAKV